MSSKGRKNQVLINSQYLIFYGLTVGNRSELHRERPQGLVGTMADMILQRMNLRYSRWPLSPGNEMLESSSALCYVYQDCLGNGFLPIDYQGHLHQLTVVWHCCQVEVGSAWDLGGANTSFIALISLIECPMANYLGRVVYICSLSKRKGVMKSVTG